MKTIWVCDNDISFGQDGAVFTSYEEAYDTALKLSYVYDCSVDDLINAVSEEEVDEDLFRLAKNCQTYSQFYRWVKSREKPDGY